jgi:malate dehydrogenase (oxaloacetate-decarboxylating)
VSGERLAQGAIYPHQSELRAVSRAVAVAVVKAARDAGVGRHLHDDEIEPAVDAMMWSPRYLRYRPAEG